MQNIILLILCLAVMHAEITKIRLENIDYYVFYNELKSFKEANDICNACGMNLANLGKLYEDNSLDAFLQNSPYWIALYFHKRNGHIPCFSTNDVRCKGDINLKFDNMLLAYYKLYFKIEFTGKIWKISNARVNEKLNFICSVRQNVPIKCDATNVPQCPGNSSFENTQAGCPAYEMKMFMKQNFKKQRVVGGTDASPGTHPWIVAIEVSNPRTLELCGGALINNRSVLTAAHCFQICHTYKDCKVTVRFGMTVYSAPESIQIVGYKNVLIKHDIFRSYNAENDVAIIRLNKPVTLSKLVRTISIIPSNKPQLAAHERVVIAGWGKDGSGSQTATEVLQELQIMVHGNAADINACHFWNGYMGRRPPNLFCAKGNAIQDSCGGDSGGPVLCTRDKFYVCGIVILGPKKCGTTPGYYYNVSTIRQWIASNS